MAKSISLIENKKESDKTCEVLFKEIRQGSGQVSEVNRWTFCFLKKKLKVLADILEKNRMEEISLRDTKIIHQHHISKAIWVAAGLFIILSLESAGWLNTVNKLDQYTENDIKYRFMKLDTTAKNLQVYLDSSDARYKSDPKMRNMVIDLEDQYQKNMERLEKAEQLKQEAKDLENKVKEK